MIGTFWKLFAYQCWFHMLQTETSCSKVIYQQPKEPQKWSKPGFWMSVLSKHLFNNRRNILMLFIMKGLEQSIWFTWKWPSGQEVIRFTLIIVAVLPMQQIVSSISNNVMINHISSLHEILLRNSIGYMKIFKIGFCE